jgi:hypothetical protein
VATYPLARICFKRYTRELDSVWDLPLSEYLRTEFADRPYGSVFRGFLASSLNNILGSFYQAPVLAPWDMLGHADGAAPADFWASEPNLIRLTEDKIGLASSGGLPGPFYWACNGAWSARYSQSTGGIDQLCCWNWQSGHRSSQALFPGQALRFGTGGTAHAFDRVRLFPYGFENAWGAGQANRSSLCLEHRSLVLDVSGGNECWLTFDFNARKQDNAMRWNVIGWDDELRALILHVGYMTNRATSSRFFPPFPEGVSEADFLAIENATSANRDLVPDRPVAGNLFLCLGGGNTAPTHTAPDQWRWTSPESLRFQITAGTTRQEASETFTRGRAAAAGAPRRCHAHYRTIQARCPVATLPARPNIEAILATAPLLAESLKLGDDKLRHSAAPSGYVDTHTSLMTMRAMLYCGDYALVERFLRFLADPARRNPKGGIGTNFFMDGGMDDSFPDWTFNDVSWLALIGHLRWHSRTETPQDLYAAGREHLLRLLADCDADTGLFRTRGYWPDHPMKDVGRNGHPWPVNEAGIWYEVLRNWEILALRRGDSALADTLCTTATRVRDSFIPLFFDPDTNLLCDSVDPETRRRHRQYSLFGLHFMYGMFGHELIDEPMAKRLAHAAFEGFYDPTWKLFRTCLPDGNFHSPFEFIYIHWLQGLTRLFRMARHTEGLNALRESFAYHYGKYANYPENVNLKPDLTDEQHGAAGWFCETLGTRIQSILEGFFALNLSPDNMGLVPFGPGDMAGATLQNLPVGTSRWDVLCSAPVGPGMIRIDEQDSPASWVLPTRLLDGGHHRVELRPGQAPGLRPILGELAGLRLVEAHPDGPRTSIVHLQGPGRAYAKFWCAAAPQLRLAGQALAVHWDPVSQSAVTEIAIATDEIQILTATTMDKNRKQN